MTRGGYTHRLMAAIGVVAVVFSFTTSEASLASAEPAGSGCTPMMAYLVPGTWETNSGANPSSPRGLMAKVGERLKRDYGSSITVLYPAYEASAFDKGKTYAASERDGVERASALMRRCVGSRVILGGFSQGADVAGDVAWQIGHGRGPVPASAVAGVGLISDPKGEKSQVTRVTGSGIAGKRPGGYGALTGRIQWLCEPKDMYCNITSKTPFLQTLGRTLGSAMNGEVPNLSGLVSDFSNVDLAGTASTADRLVQRTRHVTSPKSPGEAGDLGEIATLANQLLGTFRPIADTQRWVRSTPGAQQRLSHSPQGSPRATAHQVLSTLNGMDVDGIVRSATTIANAVGRSLGGNAHTRTPVPAAHTTVVDTSTPTPGSGTPEIVPTPESAQSTTETTTTTSPVPDTSGRLEPSALPEVSTYPTVPDASSTVSTAETTSGPLPVGGNGSGEAPDLTGLASTALTLASQVAPLKATDRTALQTAGSVLGAVRTDTIISQGLNVVSAVVGTDYAGIVQNLMRLPQQVFAGDIRGAHRTAGMLNNQFSPWVKMAAQIDYKTAAAVVGMIPDPYGYAQIASLILGLVGNVDIVRLARDIGQIQEVAWGVLETGNLLGLANLLPIGLDLASVALGVLSPGAKMSPELLGAGATTEQVQLASSLQGRDISGLVSNLGGLASSQGAQDLGELLNEGLSAASFFASNVHNTYDSRPIAGGRTAIDFLYSFFRQALGG